MDKKTITIAQLLEELDGYGIIWTDDELTAEALKNLGLSHDSDIVIEAAS